MTTRSQSHSEALSTADKSPAVVYLASLTTKKSRDTAIDSFHRISLVAHLPDWRLVPWHQMTVRETTAIRMALIDRYSPATVRLTLSVLRGVLGHCFALGLMTADQHQRAVKLPRFGGQSALYGRSLSDDEVVQLRARVSGSLMLAAMVDLALGAGLRREEIASLKVTSLKRNTVRVLGKGRRERVMPLPVWAKGSAERWLEYRKRLSSDGSLFLGRKKEPLSPWQVWRLLTVQMRDAGIDGSTHDLRRTYASRLLEQGIPITTVQHLLGHSQVTTTARYDRRAEQGARAAMAALEGWG